MARGRCGIAYSTSIAAAAAETPQRGSVHSVFAAAANIVFPDEFVLSLNSVDSPQMPNGARLSVSAGVFPFTALRPGMSVLFGAQRLHIEAIECSLDLSTCPQWDPHVYHPARLDREVLRRNGERLVTIWEKCDEAKGFRRRPINRRLRVSLCDWKQGRLMAQSLCGRGVGLTPTGDDMLAGWMAMGWLLYGATPDFLDACQQIVEVARQQTHLLSRCWLGYAARGDVALPIVALLKALARDGENEAQLVQAAQAVLAMGATSGYDVITGILLGLKMYLASPS